MRGCLRVTVLVFILVNTSCKSSGRHGTTNPDGPSMTPSPGPGSGPVEPGEDDLGPANPDVKAPTTTGGATTATVTPDPDWADMRNDCGGTKFFISTLLASVRDAENMVAGLNAELWISRSPGRQSFYTTGFPSQMTDPAKCRAVQSYFDSAASKWEGGPIGNVVKPGVSASFTLSIQIRYKDSIEAQAISDVMDNMLAPKTYPANVMHPTMDMILSTVAGDVSLVKSAPIQLKCKKPLSYQYSRFISNNFAPDSCRLGDNSTGPAPYECVAVSAFTCSQVKTETGSCPVAYDQPSLDECSFIMKDIPIFDFSGAQIAKVNMAGFMEGELTQGTRAYRVHAHRIELN